MKTITMLFVLGFSINAFPQNIMAPRVETKEQFLIDQGYEELSNREVWLAAYLAVEEIEDVLDRGVISKEQAEQAISVVLQVAQKMTEPGIIKVSSRVAKNMLKGCIAIGFGGASAGIFLGPGGVLAGGITGCFFGISVGVLSD